MNKFHHLYLTFIFVATLLLATYSMDRVYAAGERYIDLVFSDVTTTSDINYGNGQLLDLYQPVGDTLPKRPVVILVHGGGFVTGNKELWTSPARQFAQRGYVALSINYRLSNPLNTPGVFSENFPYTAINLAREDTLTAVRWAKAKATIYNLDPTKIAVMGNSAGAVTALYAAYDTAVITSTEHRNFSSSISAAISIAGGMKQIDIGKIGATDPPSLIFHGLNDAIVPPSTSQRVDERLTQLSIPHEAYYYPGLAHSIPSDATQKSLQFLKTYVINSTGTPTPPITTTAPPTSPPVTTPPQTTPPAVRCTNYNTNYPLGSCSNTPCNPVGQCSRERLTGARQTRCVQRSTRDKIYDCCDPDTQRVSDGACININPPPTTTPPTSTPSLTHTPSDTGFEQNPLLYIGAILYAIGVVSFVGARVLGTRRKIGI